VLRFVHLLHFVVVPISFVVYSRLLLVCCCCSLRCVFIRLRSVTTTRTTFVIFVLCVAFTVCLLVTFVAVVTLFVTFGVGLPRCSSRCSRYVGRRLLTYVDYVSLSLLTTRCVCSGYRVYRFCCCHCLRVTVTFVYTIFFVALRILLHRTFVYVLVTVVVVYVVYFVVDLFSLPLRFSLPYVAFVTLFVTFRCCFRLRCRVFVRSGLPLLFTFYVSTLGTICSLRCIRCYVYVCCFVCCCLLLLLMLLLLLICCYVVVVVVVIVPFCCCYCCIVVVIVSRCRWYCIVVVVVVTFTLHYVYHYAVTVVPRLRYTLLRCITGTRYVVVTLHVLRYLHTLLRCVYVYVYGPHVALLFRYHTLLVTVAALHTRTLRCVRCVLFGCLPLFRDLPFFTFGALFDFVAHDRCLRLILRDYCVYRRVYLPRSCCYLVYVVVVVTLYFACLRLYVVVARYVGSF